MDAFKLLELVGLEMDLPIIMLSTYGDTKLAKKGITHGTCDYLLKAVHIEELKNIWQHSIEVHRKFVSVANQLDLDSEFDADVPKKVLDLMNVEGLKRETVVSHLQKYRLYLGLSCVVALGSKDPSYLHMGPLDGFGYFCTLTGPGRISSASLPSYQPGGIVIQPGHSQTSNNLINGFRKIHPAVNNPTNSSGEFSRVNDLNFQDARVV
ncbi:hypothetical protein Goklo_024052, partial [Gossypium klotzschianum]|nr:hypothetical protein [Gossypium klotzschianum]